MNDREMITQQARDLSTTVVSLIGKVVEKHTVAVLEEFRDQIQARNARIAELEKEREQLLLAIEAMRRAGGRIEFQQMLDRATDLAREMRKETLK